MVAGDIRAEEIRLVWGKVVRCEEKDCYSLYGNKENRASVACVMAPRSTLCSTVLLGPTVINAQSVNLIPGSNI